jgi:hypothetical protein
MIVVTQFNGVSTYTRLGFSSKEVSLPQILTSIVQA